jgi:glycosyltransferase involved in cell wall biosynthesis
MSCGKPVLAHISEGHYKLCYPEPPPILRANTEEQIYEKLYELVTNKDVRMKIGEKSRIWVLKYHDSEKITKKLIKIYEIIGKEE